MYTNNESKPKQITSKRLSSGSGSKKVKTKQSADKRILPLRHKDLHSGGKSRDPGLRQQYPMMIRSKDKAQNVKVVNDEYYNQQKKVQKIKKANQSVFCNKQGLKNVSQASLSKEKKKAVAEAQHKEINKLTLPDSRAVIGFDGKIVKMPPNIPHQRNKHYYTSLSNSEYALTDREFTSIKGPKSRGKHKKSKSRSNNRSKSKSIQNKSKSKNYQSQQKLPLNDKKKQYSYIEETRFSPLREKQYERNEKFDLEQIYELIEEDIQNHREIKINESINTIRKKCLEMMSEICGQLNLRRQTFYLAISIFDRSASKKLNVINYQLLAIVSLSLSMKLEQSSLAADFMQFLKSIFKWPSQSAPRKEETVRSTSKNKNSLKQIVDPRVNEQAQLKKQYVAANSKKISAILQKYQCFPVSSQQFWQLQQKVTIYLRFKLWRIQAIYWADLLTCMWDQHIMKTDLDKSPNTSLFFRYPGSLANLSFLYQLLELAYINDALYDRPSVYVVLSAMYLLVRISKQNRVNGFEYYRRSLSTSTNILFVDEAGINQIFWQFLQELRVEMVQILGCCQFMAKYLQPDILKPSITHEQSKDSTDSGLSIHEFNPDLYQTFIS